MDRPEASAVSWVTVVIGTSFGVFLSALDSSVVNVSLVTMEASLGVNQDAIQWVIISYLLVLTSMMPLMGKLGDRYGKTRVFQAGMIVFVLGSLSDALSPTLPILVGSRLFQAIGASMMTANGLAIVTYFTTPENRGRAIGYNSIVLALALAVGPVVGGVLSEFYGWQSIFLVNVPIGIVGFIAVAKLIPHTQKVEETRFDTLGAVFFFTFLFVLVYVVSVAAVLDATLLVLLTAVTVVFFAAFYLQERSFISPIIPTRILSDRKVSVSVFSAILAYFGMIPVTYLLPFFLQDALGFSPMITGLLLIPQPLTYAVIGPASGYISERVNAKIQTTAGLLVETFGLVFIAETIPSVPLIIVGMVIMGSGLSFFSVANGNFIMTSSPKEYMGVVSALINVSRTAGFSVSTAVATAVFVFFLSALNPSGALAGTAYLNAYVGAYKIAIYSVCAFVLLAAIISPFRGLNSVEESRNNNQSHEEIPPTMRNE